MGSKRASRVGQQRVQALAPRAGLWSVPQRGAPVACCHLTRRKRALSYLSQRLQDEVVQNIASMAPWGSIRQT